MKPGAARFVRFLLVGGLNTAFGYGVFALLTWLGLPYPAAIGLATVAGVLFNFQTTGRLVFGSRDPARIWRFVGVYAIVYLLNVAGVAALLAAGANVYLANLLVMLPLVVLSFLLLRGFVFPRT